jgi:hypothetical protein
MSSGSDYANAPERIVKQRETLQFIRMRNYFLVVAITWLMNDILVSSMTDRMGRDSSVGIVIPYGMDGPGIETFPHTARPVLGPTQIPIQWVPGLSRG